MITLADDAIIETKERQTLRLRARLKDDAGVPVPLAAIALWQMTLYCKDDPTRAIINGRENVALITDGVVATGLAGLFRYELDVDEVLTAFFVFPPIDQKILDPKLGIEAHVCQFLIETTAVSPAVGDTLRPKFVIHVENLGRVG